MLCLLAVKVDIGLDPLVQLGLNLSIGELGGSSLEGSLAGGTAVDLEEVPAVRVEAESRSTAIAVGIGISGAEGEVGRGRDVVDVPVLGRGVAVVEDDGRETGDGVIAVGDTELCAGLFGDELGEDAVAGARATVRVDVDGVAGLTEVGRSDGRRGSAERVAGCDDLVRGVGGRCGLYTLHDGGLDLEPGGEEAGMEEAAGREIAWYLVHDEAGGGRVGG